MKIRPIPFSSNMVKAIIDGRKTQTRRVLKKTTTKFAVGDVLWVREAWQVRGLAWREPIANTKFASKSAYHYRATDDGAWKPHWGPWRASLHMPMWASRITLEVTDVRTERLYDISDDDARAEGVSCNRRDGEQWCWIDGTDIRNAADAREAFLSFWDRTNGTVSVNSNPEVVVVSFKVHHCSINDFLKREAA